MRRIVGVFLLFCLFFGFIPNVNAESYDLIYSITKLNMDTDNQIMRFEGFAFIDHMDNYGGENLKTYIIATGGGKEPKRFEVTYTDMNNGQSGYYWTRCEGSGCSIEKIGQLLETKRQSSKCNVAGKADCAYFNVEFELEIDMIDLNVYFGANTNISFEIETVNSINNTKRTSGLGVHKIVCGIDGIRGTCSNKYIDLGVDNKGKVVLGGVGETITVTANRARARIISGGAPTVVKPSIYYGGSFATLDYQTNRVSSKDNGASFITNYYIVNGQKSGKQIINGGSTQYAIYDSWVKVDGQMSIRFGEQPVIPPVEDTCESGNANASLTCGDSQTFKGCSSNKYSFNATYDLTESQINETRHPKTGQTCGILSNIPVTVNSGVLIHQEGTFSLGSIASSVYAGRSFSFPTITYENTFYWNYMSYGGGIYTSSTVYYGEWKEVIIGFSSYNCNCKKEEKNGVLGEVCQKCHDPIKDLRCFPDENKHNLTLSDTVEVGGVEDTLQNHLDKQASKEVKRNIEDTASHYSKEVLEDSIINSHDSNDVSNSMKEVVGNWRRTNSSDTWYSGQLMKGTKYSSSYKFTMFDSNVKLIGDDIGHVSYSNSNLTNYQKIGKKYYVPLLWPDGKDFKIEIEENDISFIDGIDWNLSGSCKINVDNILYGKNTPGSPGNVKPLYRYRSIDVKNPFPKDVVPVNWEYWYDDVQNKNRLKNTYNNGIVYSVSLTNGRSNGIDLGIDNINSDSRLPDYNSWDDMNQSGTSKFIINYYGSYFDKNNTNSYCEIGYFEEDCDRYGL